MTVTIPSEKSTPSSRPRAATPGRTAVLPASLPSPLTLHHPLFSPPPVTLSNKALAARRRRILYNSDLGRVVAGGTGSSCGAMIWIHLGRAGCDLLVHPAALRRRRMTAFGHVA